MKGAKPVIDLKGVSKIYRRGTREVKALDGVELHIDRGEYVVVEGPSGSGKTTLLFMVAGLVRPTAGSIVVDEAAANIEMVVRGTAYLTARGYNIVMWVSAADALTNDVDENGFFLTPVPDEIQD